MSKGQVFRTPDDTLVNYSIDNFSVNMTRWHHLDRDGEDWLYVVREGYMEYREIKSEKLTNAEFGEFVVRGLDAIALRKAPVLPAKSDELHS